MRLQRVRHDRATFVLLLQLLGPGAHTQQLQGTGVAPLRHVGSSRITDQTCVPHTGRRLLEHWATRTAPSICCQGSSVLQHYRTWFFFLNNTQLCAWSTFYLSISWRTFGLFPPCASVNSAMNIWVQVSVWMSVFSSLGYIARSGMGGSHGDSILNFWKVSKLFQNSCTILHSR